MYGSMDQKSNNKMLHEQASQRKAEADTNYFWDLVNRYKANPPNARKLNPAHEERILFAEKQNTESRVQGDNIPVERSGPDCDKVPALETFKDLEYHVPSYTMRNIGLLKYETPTPIQKHAIPLGLSGADLMCCAQTGSGKTFSFLLPAIARLDKDSIPSNPNASDSHTESEKSSSSNGARQVDQRGALPRCIILAPTRELASQIHMDCRRVLYGSDMKAITVYGGNDLRAQLQELAQGCDIVVATPGRLNDLVERGCVSLANVSVLILDEADRMLDMGFEPQIRRIVQESDMPRKEDRQTFMFSATFPDDIQKLATEFLRDYIWVGVGRVGSTVENITQQIFQATASAADKLTLLLGCLEQTDGRTLVFVQKKRTANWLCESLRKQYRIRCEEIHGDRSQAQRENALRQFRDGNIRLLIATDVAARGLDVPAVTHVIQFDMPLSAEDFDVYVHRIGRTGRAGMPGLATSFYVPGREVGEGNGKIASCLLRLFEENNQEVPEWFTHIDDLKYSNYGAGSSRNNFRGSRGGMQNRGGRFGSRDMRYNQQGSYYDQNIYQQGRYNSSDAYQNQGYNRNQDWNNGGAHRGYNNRMAQAEMPSRDVRMQYNNNMYAQGMYQNTLPRAVDQTPQLLPAAVVNGSMPVTLPMESPASPVVAGFSQAVPPNAPVGYYDPFTGAFVSGQMPAMQSPSMASMTNQFQAMGVQAGQATVDNMAEQYQMYAPRMNNDMYGDQRGYGMAQQQMYKQQQYPMAPTGGKSYNAGGNQAYGFSAMNVSYPNQMGYNTAQYGQQSMNKKNFYNQNGYNGGKYTTRDDTGGGRPGEYRPYNDGTANGSQN